MNIFFYYNNFFQLNKYKYLKIINIINIINYFFRSYKKSSQRKVFENAFFAIFYMKIFNFHCCVIIRPIQITFFLKVQIFFYLL
jgi:hypothetical protein